MELTVDFIAQLPLQDRANPACQLGDLGLLQALERQGLLPDARGASCAAVAGHLSVLEWLAVRGILPENELDVAGEVANYGHLTILQWMTERAEYRPSIFDPKTMLWAARCGDLPIVRWLLENGTALDQKAVNYASISGNRELVTFLSGQGFHPGRFETQYVVSTNIKGERGVTTTIS